MAINPDDVKLANGARAPTTRSGSTRNAAGGIARWRGERAFKHRALAQALAGFGVPKVRTRP